MTGLEAISHHNGWAMAAVGASIVLSGLAILATIISQLHKIVALLEKKDSPEIDVPQVEHNIIPDTVVDPLHLEKLVEVYQPLVAELEVEFELAELYVLAQKYHLPHPHLSIKRLREAGKLLPANEGKFCLMQ
ncbi:hypothetical protein [Desulfogranum japonicum]|uniref:hypothetical protein n=1 Tax=Desulfogranum japonicum TaxID=231447 RepID=UPI00041B4494|nr:hypothetical protein [Desulfogranum japonicum]